MIKKNTERASLMIKRLRSVKAIRFHTWNKFILMHWTGGWNKLPSGVNPPCSPSVLRLEFSARYVWVGWSIRCCGKIALKLVVAIQFSLWIDICICTNIWFLCISSRWSSYRSNQSHKSIPNYLICIYTIFLASVSL